MPEDDPAVQAAFAGVDAPRALPPGLADELFSLVVDSTPLSATSAAQLRGLDGPRAMPSGVAKAVVTAILAAVAQRETVSRRGERRLRWLGTAAGMLIIAGLLAATTRAVPGVDELAVQPTPPPFGPWFSATPPTTSTTTPPPEPPPSRVVALDESDPAYARLETFSDCDELLSWVKPRAESKTDEWGLDVGHSPTGGGGGAGAGAPSGENPPGATADRAADGRSGTNVQEGGVDEPDMVKVADGSLLMLTYEALQIIDTTGGGAALASSTPLEPAVTLPQSLLLDGSTAVVLSRHISDAGGASQLRFLDVTNPAAPVERGVIDVDGAMSDARVVGGVAHIVTGWRPGPFAFVQPSNPEDRSEVDRAAAENKRVVRESTIEQWLPSGVPCDRVAHPRDLAGFTTSLIWSVPIADPAAATVRGLIADPGIVYASNDRLVIATQRWEYQGLADDASRSVPTTVRTNLHRFALEPDGSRYLASGSVPGFLGSSYALSEHAGHLRVASTEGPPGAVGGTISTVTVLGDDGQGLLTPVGSIGGLGAEQVIVGVRFVGDVGYVVTFRRTDPLYTIDLSDPTTPRVRGALEVTGFSGYLHPLAGGRLLGVGVETDDAGLRTGGAVSLYDVSNLDDPRLAQRIVEPSIDYVATGDPHGFLLWEPTGQVVLPGWESGYVTHEDGSSTWQVTNSFGVFRVDSNGIVQQGTIDHDGHGESSGRGVAYRAAMVDGVLYTISSAGVMASDPETLEERGWAALPPFSDG